MARWGRTDFKQLKQLQKQLEKFEQVDMDAFCEKCAKDLASMLLRRVKKRTPVEQGTLRNGWTISSVKKENGSYVIEVINATEYSSYVEYGHRQTPGRYVPEIGTRLKKAWVPGKFMLTISEKEIEQLAPKYLEKKLEKKLREVMDVS